MRSARVLVLVIGVLASACGVEARPGSPAPSGPATPEDARATVLTTPLGDVRTSESFALDQFKGKVVIVLGMAVW